MWDNLIIDGFQFQTPETYKEAKKESESIAYIRAKTNLNDVKVVEKLYNKLSEKQSLHTVIGLCFLQELRERLVQSGTVNVSKLKTIEAAPFHKGKSDFPVDKNPEELSEEKQQEFRMYRRQQTEQEREAKIKNLNEFYRVKIRNLRIVIFILVLVIGAMFALNMTGNNPMFVDKEIQLQDKYAAWAEELQQREDAVTERENQLDNGG